MNLPEEDRYLQSTEELRDWLKVILAGRAAEQVVFGRITNGAANDLERATAIARAMVFEWGMGESMPHQQVRADNYALSEETKRMRDGEQRGITDAAYRDALRLVEHHREYLDRLAHALLATETLERPEIDACSRASSRSPTRRSTSASRPCWPCARPPRLSSRDAAVLISRRRLGGRAAVGGRVCGRGIGGGRLGTSSAELSTVSDAAGASAWPSPFSAAISCSLAAICPRRSAIFAAAPGQLARSLGQRVCLEQVVGLAAELVQRVALLAVQVAQLHLELAGLRHLLRLLGDRRGDAARLLHELVQESHCRPPRWVFS